MTNPEIWMNRAALFELLSKGLLRPNAETAEALASGDFAAVASEISCAFELPVDDRHKVAECFYSYRGKAAADVFHEVRQAYTHLFVGAASPCITPYIGVWDAERRGKKGILCVGKESEEIEGFMKRCGVAKNVAAGQANDPIDHVGTLCEFLSFLCLVNAKAVRPGEGARIEESDFGDFFIAHFVSYARWCAGQISRYTSEPFYGGLGLLLGYAAMIDA